MNFDWNPFNDYVVDSMASKIEIVVLFHMFIRHYLCSSDIDLTSIINNMIICFWSIYCWYRWVSPFAVSKGWDQMQANTSSYPILLDPLLRIYSQNFCCNVWIFIQKYCKCGLTLKMWGIFSCFICNMISIGVTANPMDIRYVLLIQCNLSFTWKL